MEILLCSLIGYFIGSVNPAYILSKLRGFDIRNRGSGNAGASNTVIIMGKKAGFLVAVFDICKAIIAAEIGAYLFAAGADRAYDLLSRPVCGRNLVQPDRRQLRKQVCGNAELPQNLEK